MSSYEILGPAVLGKQFYPMPETLMIFGQKNQEDTSEDSVASSARGFCRFAPHTCTKSKLISSILLCSFAKFRVYAS